MSGNPQLEFCSLQLYHNPVSPRAHSGFQGPLPSHLDYQSNQLQVNPSFFSCHIHITWSLAEYKPYFRGGQGFFRWLKDWRLKVFIAQSCLTLCNPMDCSLPGSSVHGIFQAKILAWVAIFLLQEIFPTQGLNPGLPHCRQILYPRSSKGSPSQVALVVKKNKKQKTHLPMQEIRDTGLIPGLGRSHGGEQGNPLQYS